MPELIHRIGVIGNELTCYIANRLLPIDRCRSKTSEETMPATRAAPLESMITPRRRKNFPKNKKFP